jgi:hypothetical protein
VHRFHGFPCTRGVVNGEPAPLGNKGGSYRWAERRLLEHGHDAPAPNIADIVGHSEDLQLDAGTNHQQADGLSVTDPMILEVTLSASQPSILPMVRVVELASPAPKANLDGTGTTPSPDSGAFSAS